MAVGPGPGFISGEDANDIVVLLRGGDKGTQSQDITEAKACWKEYLADAKP